MKTYKVKNYKGNLVESLSKFQESYKDMKIIEAVEEGNTLKIKVEEANVKYEYVTLFKKSQGTWEVYKKGYSKRGLDKTKANDLLTKRHDKLYDQRNNANIELGKVSKIMKNGANGFDSFFEYTHGGSFKTQYREGIRKMEKKQIKEDNANIETEASKRKVYVLVKKTYVDGLLMPIAICSSLEEAERVHDGRRAEQRSKDIIDGWPIEVFEYDSNTWDLDGNNYRLIDKWY